MRNVKLSTWLLVALLVNAAFKLLFSGDPDGGINPAIDGAFAVVGSIWAYRGWRSGDRATKLPALLLTLYLVGTAFAYGIDFVLSMSHGIREFPTIADAVWIVALVPYAVGLPLLARRMIATWDLAMFVKLSLFVVSFTASFGVPPFDRTPSKQA